MDINFDDADNVHDFDNIAAEAPLPGDPRKRSRPTIPHQPWRERMYCMKIEYWTAVGS